MKMTIDEAIAHGKEQLEVFGGEHREFIEMAIKALEQEPTTKNDLTEQCIACKYDETEDENGEHCKKCLEGDSQFGLDEALAKPTTKNDLEVKKETITYLDGFADGLNMANNSTNKMLDKIRAEIEQYQSDYDVHGTEYDRTAWTAFNRCLQILDKYKAENNS